MAKTYKKYGVTTGGYRGERAILQERVIEGLQEVSFMDQRLQLSPTSPQTIYLNSNNMADGNYIVLPNAKDLWPNWQVAIINESSYNCKIYYYTDDYTQLNIFKEVSGQNMVTCILLDDTTTEGTWTTLRTIEQSTIDLLNRYTSNVLDTIEVTWNELKQPDSDESDEHMTIAVSLGEVLAGTSIRSIYLKTSEQFEFEEESDSDFSPSISVSIGTDIDDTHFIDLYSLTNPVSDSNFTKDYFEEILSTTSNQEIYAYFTGSYFDFLKAGKVQIVVEKAKVIDPTVLKDPIVQTQIPIGVIMNYVFPDLPEGYWRLDGSPLPNAASAIPQFVQKLISMNNQQPNNAKLIVGIDEWNNIYNTYGSCGKFAWQGTSLRFPAINHFIQGLSSLQELSKLTPAGLPNHTHGPIYVAGSNNDNGDPGQYVLTDPRDYNGIQTNPGYTGGVREGGVWGNSNTVQPTSIKFPYIISIYNKIQNASMLNLEEILEDSVYKANVGLDNLSEDGVNFIITKAQQVTESNCVPDMSAGVSFSSGTQLPCNALVVIRGNPGWYNTISLYVDGEEVYCGGVSENSQRHKAGNVIARKGSTITYSGSVSSAYYYPLG